MSHRYTMMTLMGLHRLRAERNGSRRSTPNAILQALLSDFAGSDNIGDLGVLLWLCGIVCPERFATGTRLTCVQPYPLSRSEAGRTRWNWRGF